MTMAKCANCGQYYTYCSSATKKHLCPDCASEDDWAVARVGF